MGWRSGMGRRYVVGCVGVSEWGGPIAERPVDTSIHTLTGPETHKTQQVWEPWVQWLLRTRKVKMAQTAAKYRGLMEEVVLQVGGLLRVGFCLYAHMYDCGIGWPIACCTDYSLAYIESQHINLPGTHIHHTYYTCICIGGLGLSERGWGGAAHGSRCVIAIARHIYPPSIYTYTHTPPPQKTNIQQDARRRRRSAWRTRPHWPISRRVCGVFSPFFIVCLPYSVCDGCVVCMCGSHTSRHDTPSTHPPTHPSSPLTPFSLNEHPTAHPHRARCRGLLAGVVPSVGVAARCPHGGGPHGTP